MKKTNITLEEFDFDQFQTANQRTLLEVGISPFLTLEWLKSWHRHFGSDSGRVTVISENNADPSVFFTEMRDESYKGLHLRVLRSFVNSHSARAALLLSDTNPREVAYAIATNIAQRSGWDVLRLQGISCETDFAIELSIKLIELGCPAHIERNWAHVALDVPTDWLTYCKSLSKETRRVLGRSMRKLEKLGTITWKKYTEPEQLSFGFAEFLELEKRSWKAKSGEIIISDSNIKNFYAEVVEAFGTKGQIEIDLLYLDQICISGVISLLYKGRLTTPKISFDDAFAKYSPGRQLLPFILKDAHERCISHVDFYSDLPFSKHWANTQHPYCDIIAFSPSWRGQIARAARSGIETWRRLTAV